MFKRGQAYLGVFLLKDEQADSDLITDINSVHPVGVFAQMAGVFAVASGPAKEGEKEEGLMTILYPHRRINITDLVKAGGSQPFKSKSTLGRPSLLTKSSCPRPRLLPRRLILSHQWTGPSIIQVCQHRVPSPHLPYSFLQRFWRPHKVRASRTRGIRSERHLQLLPLAHADSLGSILTRELLGRTRQGGFIRGLLRIEICQDRILEFLAVGKLRRSVEDKITSIGKSNAQASVLPTLW